MLSVPLGLTVPCLFMLAQLDLFGNAFPPACEGRFTTRNTPIREVEVTPGDHFIGLWVLSGDTTMIFIRKGLSREVYEAVLQHERCHQKMYELTGNGSWH